MQSSRDKRSRRDRGRSKSRSRSRSRSRDHRRRRDSSSPPPPPSSSNEIETGRKVAAAAHTPHGATESERQLEREREQAALEEEMEKRRRRVEAWQAQRRKLQEEEKEEAARLAAAAAAAEKESAEAAAAATTAGNGEENAKGAAGWNLEDEEGLSDGEEAAAAAAAEEDATGMVAAVASEQGDGVLVSTPHVAIDDKVSVPLKPGEMQNQIYDAEEDEDPLDALMRKNAETLALQNKAQTAAAAPNGADTMELVEDDELDPLDAFMAAEVLPEVQKLTTNQEVQSPPAAIAGAGAQGGGRPASAAGAAAASSKRRRRITNKTNNRYGTAASSEDESYGESGGEGGGGAGGGDEDDDVEWARKIQAGKLSKGDKLGITDHTKMNYPPFRRNFYIEVPELARMSSTEVDSYRRSLDGVKVRGKDVPKPVKNWNQCGLSARVLETIRRAGFDTPLPIQSQALPVIMGGRDCIGIAKTGSGKTLAFTLPLIRHIKDQPPVVSGDGPVGLIMAPTRELVTQIGKEVKRFARAAGLECTCVYGGSGVANQISELKRGTEVVVCTPGRMIDILATGNGKITNLRRVTYLVMDEADRMFDMGFEPQIMRIVNNIRPDRQTVLFSATFPRSVEMLARKVLQNPVEIQVGGRSVVNSDITQFVEIRRDEERFLRLLELLGEWYERGKILIFVSSQDRCDSLFRDLLRAGYPCLSLHGGKDQSDRESTISDFKSAVCNVLVATSVAARGLDVKELVLVVNYDCPNHHEDYVHRVGRTGRAGAKGTAVTFISPDEEQYAPDLVKALKESNANIPTDLATLAEGFEKKRKAGLVKAHASGFGGSGFKFDEAEDEMVKMLKKAAAKEFGIVEESDSEGEEEAGGVDVEQGDGGVREMGDRKSAAAATASAAMHAQQAAEEEARSVDISSMSKEAQARIKAAQSIAEKLLSAPMPPPASVPQVFNAPPTVPVASMPLATAAVTNPMLAAAQAAAQRLAMQIPGAAPPPAPSAAGASPVAPNIAAAAAAALQAMGVMPAAALAGAAGAQPLQPALPAVKHYEAELEINDFPQQARWKVRKNSRDKERKKGSVYVI